MTATTPRPAATVIVLRDRTNPETADDYQIFMVKRHERSAFMAGAYVFPGGRVDESDRLPDWQTYCSGVEEASSHFPDLEAPASLRYHVAAIRELFEEAGVLLARDQAGHFISFEDPEVKTRFDGYRTVVHEGFVPLPMILKEEGLKLALDALRPYDHWITPEVERRRFDTRFFAARIPPGQQPLHDQEETVQSEWLSPDEALARYGRHEISLAPPTLRTLEDLRAFASVDAILKATETRSVIPKQPWLLKTAETLTLLLPGDSQYPVPVKNGVEGNTRFVMEDGRWHSRKG